MTIILFWSSRYSFSHHPRNLHLLNISASNNPLLFQAWLYHLIALCIAAIPLCMPQKRDLLIQVHFCTINNIVIFTQQFYQRNLTVRFSCFIQSHRPHRNSCDPACSGMRRIHMSACRTGKKIFSCYSRRIITCLTYHTPNLWSILPFIKQNRLLIIKKQVR